jgi:hypothetical protein
MKITMEWLRDNDACDEGCDWFWKNFPHGGHRDEVLQRLEETNELNHYAWLLRRTLKENPLPQGWALPEGIESLDLGGGTLPRGTRLPRWLKWLDLDGGTLPEGTALPGSLIELDLDGGTLPRGTVLPAGLRWLYLEDGKLPPGLEIPAGCRVCE